MRGPPNVIPSHAYPATTVEWFVHFGDFACQWINALKPPVVLGSHPNTTLTHSNVATGSWYLCVNCFNHFIQNRINHRDGSFLLIQCPHGSFAHCDEPRSTAHSDCSNNRICFRIDPLHSGVVGVSHPQGAKAKCCTERVWLYHNLRNNFIGQRVNP